MQHLPTPTEHRLLSNAQMYTQNTSSLYGKLLRSMLVPIAVTIAMLVSFGAWFAVRQAQESAYTLAQEKAIMRIRYRVSYQAHMNLRILLPEALRH